MHTYDLQSGIMEMPQALASPAESSFALSAVLESRPGESATMVISLTRNQSGNDAIEANETLEGPAVDVSKYRHPWELVLHVLFLSPEKRAVFHLLGSEDGFRTSIPGPTFNPGGGVLSTAPRKYIAKSADFPSMPLGKPNSQMRLSLAKLDPGANVRFSAFLRVEDA